MTYRTFHCLGNDSCFLASESEDKDLSSVTYGRDTDRHRWRDRLPTVIGDPAAAAEHPPLIRAIDTLRQLAVGCQSLGHC